MSLDPMVIQPLILFSQPALAGVIQLDKVQRKISNFIKYLSFTNSINSMNPIIKVKHQKMGCVPINSHAPVLGYNRN